MSGGLIVYLACLWTVMIIGGFAFAWWLREIGKQPPGPIQRAVIDLLWSAMRTGQTWRESIVADLSASHFGTAWRWLRRRKGGS